MYTREQTEKFLVDDGWGPEDVRKALDEAQAVGEGDLPPSGGREWCVTFVDSDEARKLGPFTIAERSMLY